MIKAILTNEILKYITEIEKNRYIVSTVKMSRSVANRLRKNSKKKSSYASNKIEGNPLSEKQVDEVIDRDERKHFLKPELLFLMMHYKREFTPIEVSKEFAVTNKPIINRLMPSVIQTVLICFFLYSITIPG